MYSGKCIPHYCTYISAFSESLLNILYFGIFSLPDGKRWQVRSDKKLLNKTLHLGTNCLRLTEYCFFKPVPVHVRHCRLGTEA